MILLQTRFAIPLAMLASRRHWMLSVLSAAAAAGGCGGSQSSPNKSGTNIDSAEPEKPLRVLVIDNTETGERIERYWSSRSDAPFELKQATAEATLGQPRLVADVVIFRTNLLGELAEAGKIAPLERSFVDGEAFRAHELLEYARTTEVHWGKQTEVICLGSPPLVLYYRADLLAAKKLSPPTSWEQYLQVAKALTDKPEGAGEAWSPSIEPLAGRWGGVTLLAWVASYARHRSEYAALFDQEAMTPLIEQPPYVRALEELVAVAKLRSPAHIDFTPADAKIALYAGDCALAWSWPTSAPRTSESKVEAAIAQHVSIAELPGSRAVYNFGAQRWEEREAGESIHVPLLGVAGLSAAITTTARKLRAAENFLAWLSASDEAVEIFSANSNSTCFRTPHLAQVGRWCEPGLPSTGAQAYVDVLEKTQRHAVTMLVPHIPGGEKYLQALGTAVRNAVSGTTTVADSLKAGASKFEEITNSLGRDKQQAAYRRSLGL